MIFVAIGVGFTGCIHPLFHAYEAAWDGEPGLGWGWAGGTPNVPGFFKWGLGLFFQMFGVLGWFRVFFSNMLFLFVDLHSVVGRSTWFWSKKS